MRASRWPPLKNWCPGAYTDYGKLLVCRLKRPFTKCRAQRLPDSLGDQRSATPSSSDTSKVRPLPIVLLPANAVRPPRTFRLAPVGIGPQPTPAAPRQLISELRRTIRNHVIPKQRASAARWGHGETLCRRLMRGVFCHVQIRDEH